MAGPLVGTIARAGAQVVLRLERRPDVVTTVSDQLAADLRAYRPHGEILTVPNEVTRPSRPAERRAVQLGRDVLQIVGVGGLIERKRPDLAVRTVAALAELGVPARLTWVGDGPLAEHCTALAKSLNVDLELTGQLPDDLVGEVLSVNDLFLVPTMAETFFLGAAEALAAGGRWSPATAARIRASWTPPSLRSSARTTLSRGPGPSSTSCTVARD